MEPSQIEQLPPTPKPVCEFQALAGPTARLGGLSYEMAGSCLQRACPF